MILRTLKVGLLGRRGGPDKNRGFYYNTLSKPGVRISQCRVADGRGSTQGSSTSLDQHTCSLSAIKSSWPLRAPCISGGFSVALLCADASPGEPGTQTSTTRVTLRAHGGYVFSMFNNVDVF